MSKNVADEVDYIKRRMEQLDKEKMARIGGKAVEEPPKNNPNPVKDEDSLFTEEYYIHSYMGYHSE